MGKILLWLQKRINHWTKPSTPVLIIGILSDITRSHTDLVVENALLRQQLIVLNRQIKRPQLTNPDRFASCFYAALQSFGKKPFISFSQIPCCAGTGNCLACIGSGNRKGSQRFHLKRSL